MALSANSACSSATAASAPSACRRSRRISAQRTNAPCAASRSAREVAACSRAVVAIGHPSWYSLDCRRALSMPTSARTAVGASGALCHESSIASAKRAPASPSASAPSCSLPAGKWKYSEPLGARARAVISASPAAA